MSALKGKIGIVTGAGSGIGGVIAKRLHADGMKLMVADVVQANVDKPCGRAMFVSSAAAVLRYR